jgi:hypothetical protein
MAGNLEELLDSARTSPISSERPRNGSNRYRFFRRKQAAKVMGVMDEKSPNHGTWITAGITLLLVLWSAWCVIYFFSLPTDGWVADPPGTFGEVGLVYRDNLSGKPSGLRPRDLVVQIEGIPLSVTG